MNRICISIVLLLSSLNMSCGGETPMEFPILEGPYMGQTPPGLVAEPFAPGIISKDGWEVEGVFAPGMQEFYYVTRSNKDEPITVIGFRQTDNVWKKYIEFPRKGEVSFSPDGARMHMAKGYKDRIADAWSERKSLGPMFDREDFGIMRLTASAKGTYVFDDNKSKAIRISILKDGERQAPEKMSVIVNSGEWTAHPFIAPDESYLIWDSEREGGFGDSDLYISFKQNDGTWGAAINMGDTVNSEKGDTYASVTSDGKYILFNRRIDDGGSNYDNLNMDIYWVDAKIIETLRPKLSDIKHPYLGQKSPGLIPKAFAPGIISTEEHLETVVSYSPDMKEFSFTRSGGLYEEPTLIVMQNKNDQWNAKSLLPAEADKYKEQFKPTLSEIKRLEPFKDIPIVGFSVSAKETIYFYVLDFNDGGSGHMSYSRLINGKYEQPIKMSEAINTGKYIAHPYIAPDESYLIWDAEKIDENTPDIYISFRQPDGSWGAAINMGDKINTPLYEQHARVTPDGKYLFYWKGDVKVREDGSRFAIGSPYWVDAQIIETLRPK